MPDSVLFPYESFYTCKVKHYVCKFDVNVCTPGSKLNQKCNHVLLSSLLRIFFFLYKCFAHFFLCLQTMHRARIDEAEKKWPESESMRPYHKERTVLDFSLAMVRETCLDKDEENPLVPEKSAWESGDPEGDSFTDEEFLLVSMTNTSVSIMEARGCNGQDPCNSCGCTLNNVVVTTTQSNITSGEKAKTCLTHCSKLMTML